MKELSFTIFTLILHFYSFSQVIDTQFIHLFSQKSAVDIIHVQKGGRLLLTGANVDYINGVANQKYVVRVLPNSSLDNSFLLDENITGTPESINSTLDSKILIGGYFRDSIGNYLGSLFRLDSNGTIDNTFFPIVDSLVRVTHIKILPNQKLLIVVAKLDTSENDLLLVEENGIINQDFISFNSNNINDIDFLSENEFFVIGYNLTPFNTQILAIDSLGTVDTNFTPQLGNVVLTDIAVLPDNKIGLIDRIRKLLVIDKVTQDVSEYSVNGTNLLTKLSVLNDSVFIAIGDQAVLFNDQFSISIDLTKTNFIYSVEGTGTGKVFISSADIELLGKNLFGLKKLNISIENGMLTNFSIDSNFQISFSKNAEVDNLIFLNDSSIISSGNFSFYNSIDTEKYMIKFNPDWSVDSTFHYNLNSPVGSIHKFKNDNLLIVNGSAFSISSKGEFITNFNDGSFGSSLIYGLIDSNQNVLIGECCGHTSSIFPSSTQDLIKFDSLGNKIIDFKDSLFIYLHFFDGLSNDLNGNTLLFGNQILYVNAEDTFNIVRFGVDGQFDEMFNYQYEETGLVENVYPVSNGSYFVNNIKYLSNSRNLFFKINSSGQKIKEFQQGSIVGLANQQIDFIYELPDSSIIVDGFFDNYNQIKINKLPIVLDKYGNYIGPFMPEIENISLNKIIQVDDSTYYFCGLFEGDDFKTSIMRVYIQDKDGDGLLETIDCNDSDPGDGNIFINGVVHQQFAFSINSNAQLTTTAQYDWSAVTFIQLNPSFFIHKGSTLNLNISKCPE